jgi:hypothetical protein
MGVPGFEPGTSALSELRSNQLSYTPFTILEFLRSECVMSSDRRKVSCIDRMNPHPERNLQSRDDLSAPGPVSASRFRIRRSRKARQTQRQHGSLNHYPNHAGIKKLLRLRRGLQDCLLLNRALHSILAKSPRLQIQRNSIDHGSIERQKRV